MIHLESHLAFTCRCSKVGAVSGRGVVRTGSVRKDERRRFFFSSPKLRQRPFWPSRPQTYIRSQASEGSRPRAAAIQPLHVSSRTHLPPPSLLHLQRDSKELTPTIHGHLAKASVLRAVATATASHTHMCGIGGQGSWVVLAGLNGALCVIIQTSSNPKLWKVMQKKKKEMLSLQQKVRRLDVFTKGDDTYDQIMLFHLWACSIKFRFGVNYSRDQQVNLFSQMKTTLLSGQERGEFGRHVFARACSQVFKYVYMRHTHGSSN